MGAPPDWPEWQIGVRRGGDPPAAERMDESGASLALDHGGRLDVDRASRSAVFTLPEPPSGPGIVHPYLAPVAAIAAHWAGRTSFHAGAFVAGGRAWVAIGDRGAGKSSLMAALAALGTIVLVDDLLVVDGGRALAGPRCVDLRDDAAAALEQGVTIGTIGGRERWRVELGDAAPTVPLGGFVELGWGDVTEVAAVPVAARLPLLLRSFALRAGPPDPDRILDLAALPMLRFARPRRWDALEPSARALARAVEETAG